MAAGRTSEWTTEDSRRLRYQLSLCPYGKLCKDFLKSLNLNDGFFNPEYDQCFCENCHWLIQDKKYYQRGIPPKIYGLPIGWHRFGLRWPPQAKVLDVKKNWHRAFHGTRHQSLNKILEVGGLVEPGRTIRGGATIKELPGHFNEGYKPDGFNTKKVFVSPSIHYAGHSAYAAPKSWQHQNKTYSTKVALQVFIDPKEYEVGPETLGAGRKQIDPVLSNDSIEWFTSVHGSTILYGLLVKVDEPK